MTVADAPSPALPRTYLTWLSGFTVGRLGDATLAFALGWAAAGLGGSTAALVLVLGGLPGSELHVVEAEGHGGELEMALTCRVIDGFANR